MNRAQRRAAKSKRGGKRYMESSKQVRDKNTKAYIKLNWENLLNIL